MTIRHYQIFAAVCETMSMTGAAGALYMSQSAVSQAVAELEAHYGARLFERLPRKLYLTRAGEKLLTYARHILRMDAEAEREMRSWNDTGVVRVGASVTIGACVLPGLAAGYQRRFPGAPLEVTEDNTERIERLLMEDKLDLGLVEGEVSLPDIVEKPFASDELTLICGRDHPFFTRTAVEPVELEAQRFIVREVGSGTRRTFETAMAERGLKWTAVWTCNNADTIKAAVAEGLGVSVISRRAVEREARLGLLWQVEVTGLSFARRFKVIYHKNKYLTGAMKAFVDFCFQEGGAMTEGIEAEVEKRRRAGNRMLFSRDSACLRALVARLAAENRRTLVLWALDCAEGALAAFEALCPGEGRPRAALEASAAWARGDIKMPEAKRAILDAHAAAKEAGEPRLEALAHAVGQAASTTHVKTHAEGLVIYELTAIALGGGEWDKAVAAKIGFYLERLDHWRANAGAPEHRWARFLRDDG